MRGIEMSLTRTMFFTALGLSGCLTSQADYLVLLERSTDWDLDGHKPPKHGGDDCDDDRADVHPGADEDECDGVDEDCDGLVDEGVTVTWYEDADGDGFGLALESAAACEPPGDAWSFNAGDCDDLDAAVHPDAVEVCGDRKDNDCDGSAGDCSLEGEQTASDFITLLGDRDERQGEVLAHGQWAGDENEDLLVGSGTGEVVVITGPIERSQQLASAGVFNIGLPRVNNGDRYIPVRAVNVSDMDGNGAEDFAVVAMRGDAPEPGVVFFFYPPVGVETSPEVLGEDPCIYADAGQADEAPWSLASAGDVNDDGFADVWLGTPEAATSVSLFLGPISVSTPASAADLVLTGGVESFAGWDILGGEDYTGDGVPDLVASTITNSNFRGGFYVVPGPDFGASALGDVGLLLEGPIVAGGAGVTLAGGDVNGDGHLDVLVAAIDTVVSTSWGGGAYVLTGPFEDTTWGEAQLATFLGGETEDRVGHKADLADINGDLRADVMLSAPFQDYGSFGQSVGATRLYLDVGEGTYALDDATSTFWGDSDADFAGGSAMLSPDLNGDGLPDVVIGAPMDDYGGNLAGAAYLIPFTSL